jgi:hypothetical protein
VQVCFVLRFGHANTPKRCTHGDADSAWWFLGESEPGIGDCHVRGNQGELGETVQTFALPVIQVRFDLQVNHGSDLRAVWRRIEPCETADSGFLTEHAFPQPLATMTNGRDSTDTGNNDAPCAHVLAFLYI